MSIYRKVRKFIFNPKLFFFDYVKKGQLKNKSYNKSKNKTIYNNKYYASYYKLPNVFNMYNTDLDNIEDKKFFIYINWINTHQEKLIKQINRVCEFNIYKINLFSSLTKEDRKAISTFSKEKPWIYKWFLRNRLVPLKNKIYGMIFTHDWHPVMRLAVEVCHELNIPTILIPHESVFLDEEKYYLDPISSASVPACNMALVWGELQKRIFLERGYPEECLHVVGSPKLDTCANYTPCLTREQFCHFYGFNPNLPIFLFATQFLDNQTDTKIALEAQRHAISDALEFCQIHSCQLLVRQPPNGSDILNTALRSLLLEAPYAAIDHSSCYQTTSEESIFHSEVVLSINSTMLFEAIIMERKAFSMKYIEFNPIWSEKLIPYARNKIEFFDKLIQMRHQKWGVPVTEFDRLKHEFGIGKFDGLSCHRIYHKLRSIISETGFNSNFVSPINRLLLGKQLDVLCISSSKKIFNTTQLHLKTLLRCRTLLNVGSLHDVTKLSAVQIFLQWGNLNTENKTKQNQIARFLGRPKVYIEDGFIRSYGIGLSGEPGLSIIIDDLAPYYDATRASRLETYLASNELIPKEMRTYCQDNIAKIVEYKISKYNAAPDFKLQIGSKNRKKLLLIDQRYGDMSVVCGLADIHTFERMLSDALDYYADWDIIIKQHPDAIKGGKSSYFDKERLYFTKCMENVFIIDYDINPYSLIEAVDEVFVCTSMFGFEACMAGKKVHCYGMPFYAGWGITEDKIKISRRNKNRDIIDIFYFSYVCLSRYIDPRTNKQCSIEDLIDYFRQRIGQK